MLFLVNGVLYERVGNLLIKAGRRAKPSPGQMDLFSMDAFAAPAALVPRKTTPKTPKTPKPATAKPPKVPATPGLTVRPKEGDRRINRAGNEEILRGGRWRRFEAPEPTPGAIGGLSVIEEEPTVDDDPGITLEDLQQLGEEVIAPKASGSYWHGISRDALTSAGIEEAFKRATGLDADEKHIKLLLSTAAAAKDGTSLWELPDDSMSPSKNRTIGMRHFELEGFVAFDRLSQRFFITSKGIKAVKDYYKEESKLLGTDLSVDNDPVDSFDPLLHIKSRREIDEIERINADEQAKARLAEGPKIPDLNTFGKRVADSIRQRLNHYGMAERDLPIDLWQAIEYAKHDRGLSWPKAVDWAMLRRVKPTPILKLPKVPATPGAIGGLSVIEEEPTPVVEPEPEGDSAIVAELATLSEWYKEAYGDALADDRRAVMTPKVEGIVSRARNRELEKERRQKSALYREFVEIEQDAESLTGTGISRRHVDTLKRINDGTDTVILSEILLDKVLDLEAIVDTPRHHPSFDRILERTKDLSRRVDQFENDFSVLVMDAEDLQEMREEGSLSDAQLVVAAMQTLEAELLDNTVKPGTKIQTADEIREEPTAVVEPEEDIVKPGDRRVIDGITYELKGDPLRWHRVDEELQLTSVLEDIEDVSTEGAEAEAGTDAGSREPYNIAGDDDGGIDGDRDSGSNRIVEPRLVTARADITKSADPGLVSESVRDYLREHQLQGAALAIESMDRQGGFLLADGTGAGKTRQMLAIAKTYAEQGKKVLIVAPSEVIKPNWKKGVMAGSFANDSAAMGIDISLEKESTGIANGAIVVTTYNRLSSFKGAVDKDTVLIFDEAHSLKNSTSARTKHGLDMMRKADRVCLATATPADKPEHIPYLFKTGILGGNKLEDINKWLGLVPRQIDTGRKVITTWELPKGAGAKAEVFVRMSGLFDQLTENGSMIKRELSMQGDVDVSFETITLPDQAHEMLDAIAEAFDHGEGSGLRKAQMLMHQRRQLEPYKITAAVDTAKQELAAGRQVILFVSRVNKSEVLEEDPMVPVGDVGMVRSSAFSPDGEPKVIAESEGTAKLLREALESAGITSIAELHGNADTKADVAMNDFQSGNARVLIATVESGGTGVNLDDTVGDAPRTMIMITPPFNAVQNLQAAGRVWRMTTKSSPKIRYLFTDTDVDSWNRSIIASKMAAVGAAVRGETGVLDLPEDVTDDAIEAFIAARDKGQSIDLSSPAPRPPKREAPAPKVGSTTPPGFRVNKYGGYTAGGTYVKAGEGYIRNENGKWVTYAKSQIDENGNVIPEPKEEIAPVKVLGTPERVAMAGDIITKINSIGEGKTPYSANEIEAIISGIKWIETEDNDRGEEINKVGWSGTTRSDGLRLAKKINSGLPLSATELSDAARLVNVHRRQMKQAGIDIPPHKEPVVEGLELTPTVWNRGDFVRVYLNGPKRTNYGYFDITASGDVRYETARDSIQIDAGYGLGKKGKEILQAIAPDSLTKSIYPRYYAIGGASYVIQPVNGSLAFVRV